MAKTRSIQNSFLSGELSPLIKGNTSLAQYYQGLERAEDVMIVPQGGVKRRGGLEFMGESAPIISRVSPSSVTMVNGGTPGNIDDDDDSTTTVTTTAIGTTSPYIVARADLGTAKTILFADLRVISIIPNGAVNYHDHAFKIQYSSDDAAWFDSAGGDIDAVDPAVAFSRRTSTRSDPSSRYWRVVLVGAADIGTAVVDLAGFDLYEGGAVSGRKLLDFNSSADSRYLFVVSEGNIAIYPADNSATTSESYNIKVPYLSSEISSVRHVTTENVSLIFHENHPTQRVIFNGLVDGFAVDDAPFTNVPLFDFNDSLSPTPVSEVQDATFASFTIGQTYQIDVEGVLSKQITYAGDANADQQSSTAFNMQKNLQEMPNFGETGVSVARTGALQYTITIAGESADSFELFSGFNTTGAAASTITFAKTATGSPRREAVWGSNRGYPRLGAFFEGRLWLGGTRDKKQSVIASKSGDLLDFDTGEGADDEGIFVTITSRNLTEIVDIYPGRNLQIFTSGGEYAVLEANVTPAAINIRAQTSNGALYVPAQESDGSVIYCDKNGKTLREYIYTFNEDSYASSDISVLSSHLIKTPIDSAFLNGTASDDANWLFVLNTDGSIAILNKLRSQDINGFTNMSITTQFNVSSTIEAVEVVDDQVFFAVKRYDSSDGPICTIERMNFDRLVDGSIKKTVTVGTVLDDLDHLIL
jgi:hypothetical protein